MTFKIMTLAFVLLASVSGGAANVKSCTNSKSVELLADSSGQDTTVSTGSSKSRTH